MKTIEVKINDKKYKCNISLCTCLKYEEIFEMPSNSEKGIKAIINLFYDTLFDNNENFELSYEEYIDALDDNMESLTEFSKLLVDKIQKNNIIARVNTDSIITRKGISNLCDMMQSNTGDSVEYKIKGDTIVGIINRNTNNENNRSKI